MWSDKLKDLGVSIHVIATGAGAGIQQTLWGVPGSSAYLSGASFPYSPEEQTDLLGFMPEHFCNEEASIDLASAAYMKAYKFGGKRSVGVGLTGSVASEKEHRGDHRVHVCIITDDQIRMRGAVISKGSGQLVRAGDGHFCDELAFTALIDVLGISGISQEFIDEQYKDATETARRRFFERPFFAAGGQRMKDIPNVLSCPYALVPGSFNPPHDGHFGMAENVLEQYGRRAVFEITASTLHKGDLSVQQLLQRAKLLQGHDRLFTETLFMYLDKTKAYPGIPIVIGADSMLRMLDPKWGGKDVLTILGTFEKIGAIFYVCGREIDGKFVGVYDIGDRLSTEEKSLYYHIAYELDGEWNVSSTQIRAQHDCV